LRSSRRRLQTAISAGLLPRPQQYDFDTVIVREGDEGARCDSLTKTRNSACQLVTAFGTLGEADDELYERLSSPPPSQPLI
jgi:hypothetical protein